MTRPIESVRPVTSVRAARFGTYLSFTAARSTARRARGLTLGLAVKTLEAVARETPASLATSSSVGIGLICGSALTPSLYTLLRLLSRSLRERSPNLGTPMWPNSRVRRPASLLEESTDAAHRSVRDPVHPRPRRLRADRVVVRVAPPRPAAALIGSGAACVGPGISR